MLSHRIERSRDPEQWRGLVVVDRETPWLQGVLARLGVRTATANAAVERTPPSRWWSAARLFPLCTLSSTKTTTSDLGTGIEVRTKPRRISSAVRREPLVFAATGLRCTASTATFPSPTPSSARHSRSVRKRAVSMVSAVTSDDRRRPGAVTDAKDVRRVASGSADPGCPSRRTRGPASPRRSVSPWLHVRRPHSTSPTPRRGWSS